MKPATTKPLYPEQQGPFTVIVQSGVPQARIVLSASPTQLEQFAATELQTYLESISGARFDIVAEPDDADRRFAFILGNTRRAAKARLPGSERTLGRDGFVLRSTPGGIFIKGRNDLGTVFGVYELLERVFDVRWFMPGVIGEEFPRSDTLQLGTINLVVKPAFRVRRVGTGEWSLRQRMNAYVTAEDRDVGIPWKWHFHTFAILMPPEKYHAEHPEYYALVNGKRFVTESRTHGNQLCTSNPDVVREVASNMIAALDAEPGIEIITLSPNDGGGFCECEKCLALDEPGRDWFARYSRRMALFNNEVARLVGLKHPKVLIKVGAYAMYTRTPLDKDFRPEPNLFFQLCHLYFCHNHSLAGEGCRAGVTYDATKPRFQSNQEFRKILKQWKRLSPHLFVYEYYTIGGMARAGLPWPLVHTICRDIPWYRDQGIEGFYTQLGDELWYRLGLNYYLAAKLCWNPDLDPEALLDDTFTRFYGPAAAPMHAFFRKMEDAMQTWDGCVSYGLMGESGESFGAFMTDVLTPPVLARMEEHLSHAERLTAGNERLAPRVALARRMLDETQQDLAIRRTSPRPPLEEPTEF